MKDTQGGGRHILVPSRESGRVYGVPGPKAAAGGGGGGGLGTPSVAGADRKQLGLLDHRIFTGNRENTKYAVKKSNTFVFPENAPLHYSRSSVIARLRASIKSLVSQTLRTNTQITPGGTAS